MSEPLPRASRSTGLPAFWGKATEDVKARVPAQVRADWDALAHDLGMSSSELLREVMMLRLYGPEFLQSLASERLRVVAGTWPESGAIAIAVNQRPQA